MSTANCQVDAKQAATITFFSPLWPLAKLFAFRAADACELENICNLAKCARKRSMAAPQQSRVVGPILQIHVRTRALISICICSCSCSCISVNVYNQCQRCVQNDTN